MARSSGDTLSLNDLAGARGITQNSNVSLNAINSSAGTIVSLDNYGKGIYFLEIETNDGVFNKKLILQ